MTAPSDTSHDTPAEPAVSDRGVVDGGAPDHSTVIRTAGSEDRAQVKRLLNEILEFHGVPAPATSDLEATLDAIFADPDHLFLVADSGGRLDAMCALIFSQSTWSAAPVCEVQDVVVSAHARGRGVGSALLEEAFALARSRGCARAYLAAETWNFDAHSFYRQMGFAEKTCLYFEKNLRDQPEKDSLSTRLNLP